MRKSIIFSLIFTGFLAGSLFAEGAGTSGGVALDQLISIRASGMAEAYTAVEGDIGAINYNPAGLAVMSDKQASFAYQRGIAEDTSMLLLYGQPSDYGVWGGAFSYYTAGDIDLLDTNGNERTVKAEQDYVGVIGYARHVIETISVGVNIKGLSSTIAEEESASAVALDLGALYRVPFEGLSLGLAVKNLGTKLTYIDEGDDLPLTGSFGAAYAGDLGSHRMLLSADARYRVYDEIMTPAFGAEFGWHKVLHLRAGYAFNSDYDTGLTIGMGLAVGSYTFNYSFGMSDDLNNSHRISLDVRF